MNRKIGPICVRAHDERRYPSADNGRDDFLDGRRVRDEEEYCRDGGEI